MSTTVLVLTRGSVFDVCAIIDFYLRVLCAPLPLSRLAVATVVSTAASSQIPIHFGTLYFKPLCRTSTDWPPCTGWHTP